MNKKQRNRKDILQNKRNRIQNRRYKTTIKTLMKVCAKIITEEKLTTLTRKMSNRLIKNEQKLHSFIDKAVKKNIIHKNNASRKKRKIELLIRTKN